MAWWSTGVVVMIYGGVDDSASLDMEERLEAKKEVIVLGSCSVENLITKTNGGCCNAKELVVLLVTRGVVVGDLWCSCLGRQ
ncbi:hypothetical protein NC652_040905 [Populus alba x Populus x berolinensis]|nr:hypothetical protein NC652_040905 [Populus alba x Populus x berolinensis]